jgi:hypothetical protein
MFLCAKRIQLDDILRQTGLVSLLLVFGASCATPDPTSVTVAGSGASATGWAGTTNNQGYSGTGTSVGGSGGIVVATGSGGKSSGGGTGGKTTAQSGAGGKTTAQGGVGATTSAQGGTGGTTTSSEDCDLFSFFVTSQAAVIRESKSSNGFGGDLGGLAGADKICQSIAAASLECAGNKTWHAFLSTSTENAIDRVGSGPWYDRKGRVVALKLADLQSVRPASADSAIKNDLPNEDGVPNHSANGTKVDNHDTLTGSDNQGKYIGSADGTCNDWTSTGSGKPRIGHSWPGGPSENWVNAHTAPGCAAGINTSSQMGESGSCVGCSGGYGGFYCFALTP